MASIKTNVMRILDKEKIEYETTSYQVSDGKIDGVAVAAKIKKAPEMVFKTLVVVGASKENYVFVIPVAEELDFKKVSKLVSEKSVEMLSVKDLQKVTGYIRGGCSPIGMKKKYKTYFHETIKLFDKITFSAGKIGIQITVKPLELKGLIEFEIGDIIKK